MDIRDGLIDAIGNTPLIRLHGPSQETGCEILGKAEWLNPGGSVKDRAALGIIRDAEASGRLRPGGTIVEGTAGNTGIGLAHVANAKGYHTVIVIPETQSQEKKDALIQAGAKLVQVPAVPYKNPNNYIKISARLAEHLAKTELNGAIWANQFDNTANRDGHYRTTGPEIWQQTGGKLDAFTCAVGSGGTIAGVSRALKERNPDVKIILADPHGAAMYSWVTTGELKSEGSSITEGIGQGRVTANIADTEIDGALRISDAEALTVLYRLIETDGIMTGGSGALNVAAAIRVAKELGPGHTVVTILCDHADRYRSKLFNLEFLRAKGLPTPRWLEDQDPAQAAAWLAAVREEVPKNA